jgi:hypothetical protein
MAQKQYPLPLYFQKSELQLETKSQCGELKTVFNDILILKPKELRAKRYANYQGAPEKWSVVEILNHYLAPETQYPLIEKAFFREYRFKATRYEI